MTVHTNETASSAAPPEATPRDTPSNALPALDARSHGIYSQTPTVVDSYPLHKLDTSSRAPLVSNPIDRELRSIDNMYSEEEEPIYGSADTDTVLSYRARKITRRLEARSITPASSRAEMV